MCTRTQLQQHISSTYADVRSKRSRTRMPHISTFIFRSIYSSVALLEGTTVEVALDRGVVPDAHLVARVDGLRA